jgi:large subunit ribosomal protein L3
MGKKKGMTRIFDDKGNLIVCTVIEAEPNVVAQIKQKETDGYSAIQLGAFKARKSRIKNLSRALQGHFAKAKVEPRHFLCESRTKDGAEYTLGQEIGIDYFSNIPFVDVTGVSKGRGHQGVIRRHGFAGGPGAHGSGFHRHGGSTGMRTSPGRCLPGQKKSGHMGAEQVTVQNLKVVQINAEKNTLLVQGAIPGAPGSLVYVFKSIKGKTEKKAAPKAKAKK